MMKEVKNMEIVAGEWTKIDKENKITEVSFITKDELIAKMTFDLSNDEVSIEGDLQRVTEKKSNDDLVKTYLECSKEILNIM